MFSKHNGLKAVSLFIVGAGAAVTLVACGSPASNSSGASATDMANAVDCSKVSAEIDNVNVKLTALDKAKADKLGTPGYKDAVTAYNTEHDYASALNIRANSTDCGGTGKTTEVIDPNGQRTTVPVVSGETITNGLTTTSQTMPALNKLLPDCGTLLGWDTIYDCVNAHHAQWYIDGVNRLAPYTHYNWADVKTWATHKAADGKLAESRVIFLTGSQKSLSDAQAREHLKGLLPGANLATINVVRLDAAAFMNTWRTSGASPNMTDFADYNNEARVSLVPMTMKGDVVASINGDLMMNGLFVDCYNVHGLYPVVPPKPNTTLVCLVGPHKGQPIVGNSYTYCNPPTSNSTPTPRCTVNCGTTPACTTNCNTKPTCTTNCGTCPCVDPTQVQIPVQEPGQPTVAVPSAPVNPPATTQPTRPVNTGHPAPPTSGGNNGGSTSQPGTSAPPETPLPSATATGDPGGF